MASTSLIAYAILACQFQLTDSIFKWIAYNYPSYIIWLCYLWPVLIRSQFIKFYFVVSFYFGSLQELNTSLLHAFGFLSFVFMAWLRSPWYPPASTPQNLINFGLNSWGFHIIDSRAIPTHMILEWPLKRYGFYGTKEDPKQDNDSWLLFDNFNLLENYGFISWFELNCLFSGFNMTLDPLVIIDII